MSNDRERLAEAVRRACVQAWREGYAAAGMSGLCAEGALEAALSAVQELDLAPAIAAAESGVAVRASTSRGPAISDALELRRAGADDWAAIWPFFRAVVEAGESYPYPSDIPEAEARAVWMQAPQATYVAERDGRVVGSYYIKPNQLGRGAHVCNCGYMVAPEARGAGVATAMCLHSQAEARRLGFRAMQFNLVVSANEPAVHLWRKLGFEHVGTLPKAFDHARLGLVDALVMYRWLD